MTRSRSSRAVGGAILVLIAISLVLLVAIAALAVDLGWVYVQEARVRTACNAAALSAARKACGGASPSAIAQAARNFAALHGVTVADSEVQINPYGNCSALVRIAHRETAGLFFAPLLGNKSMQLGYSVLALPLSDDVHLFSDPPDTMAASALIPLYIPHADLLPVLDGRVKTAAGLAACIYGPSGGFTPGQRLLLKSGSGLQQPLRAITGKGGGSQQGALMFAGQGNGDSGFRAVYQAGYGGVVSVGDVMDTLTGTMDGPTQQANAYRVSQDPLATWSSVSSMSARLVVVPIAVAVHAGPDDAGTGIPNLRNISHIWDGSLNVQVIGFAEVFLEDCPANLGSGVVTGVFIRYVGTRPLGQGPG